MPLQDSPAPSWTLITVTHNSQADLAEFWDHPRPDWVEWLVVDNASTDDSAGVAKSFGADSVITLERNVGFGSANNVALAGARGSYVAFVNPDVAVDFDSLAVLARELDAVDGLVSPQLQNSDGSLQPNGRGFPTIWNKILHRLRGDRPQPDYVVFAAPGESKYVCWAIGAAVAGRTSTVRELGGWNERFFVYYEDSDLGMRAWAAGYPVTLVGDALWRHGWARETTGFRLRPYLLELDSMSRFYTLHPRLLLPLALVNRSYPGIARAYGTPVTRPSLTA